MLKTQKEEISKKDIKEVLFNTFYMHNNNV